MKKNYTIATRGSKLALWQANHIASLVQHQHQVEVKLLVLKTKGDIILDVPLAKVGGKGLFVKEIEEALLDGRADFAVHSMKDVPMQLPAGLQLGVIPEREVPYDLFLSTHYPTLADLPQGATVGTSSLRRQAQLLAIRPDLAIVSLRGNVDTRLRKLLSNEFDAIIMAAAGFKRLGLTAPHMQELTPPSFLPAAGQGALGIEYAEERNDVATLLAFLQHQPTYDCVSAERAFLAGLEGSCQVPIAAFATLSPTTNNLHLDGFLADCTGTNILKQHIQGDRAQACELGTTLAEQIMTAGGRGILDELYKGQML